MASKSVEFSVHALGVVAKGDGFVAFFGDRRAQEGAVETAFPEFQFRYLKQVHSAKVVRSAERDRPEADAHWTAEPGVALAIRTADCMPILLASASARAVAAIHAGWRGMEGEIILQTGVALLEAGFPPVDFSAFVGPSIGPQSFEVGADVGDRLEAAFRKTRFDQSDSALLPHDDPAKARVDLGKIAAAHLRAEGIPPANVFSFLKDTFADQAYFSYRRDREQAGRQVSFVALR